jgi:SAM-dependent methyltransferase
MQEPPASSPHSPDLGSSSWWNRRYRQDSTPWDTGIVPPELHELLDSGQLKPPGVTLDLGCGTGTNVNYLSSLGFQAYGVDLAWLAVATARTKARDQGLPARFCVGNVADLGFLDLQASFALDMGCLHSLSPDNRDRYARSLAERMLAGGLYLLYGFDQETCLDSGPAGFLEGEIARRFAPHFRQVWRRPSLQGDKPVAWYLLQRL